MMTRLLVVGAFLEIITLMLTRARSVVFLGRTPVSPLCFIDLFHSMTFRIFYVHLQSSVCKAHCSEITSVCICVCARLSVHNFLNLETTKARNIKLRWYNARRLVADPIR